MIVWWYQPTRLITPARSLTTGRNYVQCK